MIVVCLVCLCWPPDQDSRAANIKQQEDTKANILVQGQIFTALKSKGFSCTSLHEHYCIYGQLSQFLDFQQQWLRLAQIRNLVSLNKNELLCFHSCLSYRQPDFTKFCTPLSQCQMMYQSEVSSALSNRLKQVIANFSYSTCTLWHLSPSRLSNEEQHGNRLVVRTLPSHFYSVSFN